MINRSDLLLLLTELENSGIDTKEQIAGLYKTNNLLTAVKFLNEHRQLDLSAFYENIRKNYNKKKSNLYKNLVNEEINTKTIITTLSSLLLQIFLYAEKLDNKHMFLRHARANDILKVLSIYTTNHDLTNCIKLIKLFKADIKALESVR